MGSLRTFLALSVAFAHTSHWDLLLGGMIPVQLFYMISGFLISYVLLNTPSYRDVRTFWLNRALRLYPVYFFVVLLTIVVFSIASGFWLRFANLPFAAQAVLAVTNVTIIGQDWVMFMGLHGGALHFTGSFAESEVALWRFLLVPQAWTLGIELSFYAIAPFIVRRPLVLIALFAASIVARAYAIQAGFGTQDPWSYRFFPFELALFIMGVASHQLLLAPARRLVAKASRIPIAGLVLLLSGVVYLAYAHIAFADTIKLPALYLLTFLSLPFLFLFQSTSRLDRWIGDLSYPLYICHALVILIVSRLAERYAIWPAQSLAADVGAVACALGFAVVLKIVVADPVEMLRSRVKKGPDRLREIRTAVFASDGSRPAPEPAKAEP